MKQIDIKEIFSQRPSVHKLYYGGFIQEVLKLKENIYAVPLKALGFATEATYTSQYVVEICQGNVEQIQLDTLLSQGEQALPVIALVVILDNACSPEIMEADAEKQLLIPEKIVSWSAGESLVPFAFIICDEEQHFFRVIPPNSRRIQRLGFGNTDSDYSSKISKMVEYAEKDEHFLFAISLYKDALAEDNQVFKIARFFSCLESLAYKIKSDKIPSRKAVKTLLGLEQDAMVQLKIGDNEYKFDRIEIAGRLRDKLYHGVPFKESDLNTQSKHVFDLIKFNPELIAGYLRDDCELEFARWANGTSSGFK
jgi:hypothetical protein